MQRAQRDGGQSAEFQMHLGQGVPASCRARRSTSRTGAAGCMCPRGSPQLMGAPSPWLVSGSSGIRRLEVVERQVPRHCGQSSYYSQRPLLQQKRSLKVYLARPGLCLLCFQGHQLRLRRANQHLPCSACKRDIQVCCGHLFWVHNHCDIGLQSLEE